MNNDMKCPVCNVLLDECGDLLCCPNDHCAWVGNKELWQELIRTRKALDVAVDALKRLEKELYFNNAKQTGHIADSVMSIPSLALEQITALEQKDKQ